jgi:hypothetical protein
VSAVFLLKGKLHLQAAWPHALSSLHLVHICTAAEGHGKEARKTEDEMEGGVGTSESEWRRASSWQLLQMAAGTIAVGYMPLVAIIRGSSQLLPAAAAIMARGAQLVRLRPSLVRLSQESIGSAAAVLASSRRFWAGAVRHFYRP